ncbi:DNA replication and repair protein RecF [Verrucomicrobiota bacterium]|nr:DNA replication and repair protein RecF [Verrucomicrobiota bacterium]
MRLTRIRAADFRNLTFADVSTDAPRVFLLGDNGHGKTNLLEAAGLVSAFRSFRTTEITPLIRAGQGEARLRLDVALLGSDRAEVEVRLAKGSRKALLNGTPVTSVAQHLGQFPTIVFCSDDLRLVRGSPGNRRRWLDAAIGGTDGDYLTAVRSYTRALEGRNALLKSEQRSEEELRAFEQAMQAPGQLIVRTRAQVLPELAATLREACARAGFPDRGADLRYQPDCAAEQLTETWLKMRPADLAAGTTLRGPQRDDFGILFGDEDASDYASEGQQRLLVLALSLARLQRDTRRAPTPPVILADDVLGELDDTRRLAFWDQVGEAHQVIATGTVPPPSGQWLTYRVTDGAYALV